MVLGNAVILACCEQAEEGLERVSACSAFKLEFREEASTVQLHVAFFRYLLPCLNELARELASFKLSTVKPFNYYSQGEARVSEQLAFNGCFQVHYSCPLVSARNLLQANHACRYRGRVLVLVEDA